MPQTSLDTPVRFLTGVGPERAALLDKIGLRTVEDVLWNMPRGVLDLTEVRSPDELHEGELQTVRGSVADVDGRELSGGRRMSAVLLDCGAGQFVRGVWFNQPWVHKTFRMGRRALFSAKPKRRSGRWEFAHPQVQWLDDDDPNANGAVLPRYSLTEGLKMHELRRITRDAVERFAGDVPEYLPEPFRASLDLPHVGDAFRRLHLPKTMREFDTGRRRIIFDDLLEFQLGLALRRRARRRQDRAPVLSATTKIDARIRRLFPFAFTNGQDEAVREIVGDLASGRAMHRLLHADVGAGKTAVALYAMLVAVAAGYQTVLMAPTEVLASQHWSTLEEALANSRVNRLLLTGNLTRPQRRKALSQIASGEVQIVVGTQAVIQKDVRFCRLGLAVIDEQHKFGVLQRAHFTSRQNAPSQETSNDPDSPQATTTPHVLVMTATPIPRSLCLTQFGDLDVTAIRELPPGRQKVITSRIAGERERRKAWEFVRSQLASGRQAYVVFPRIEAKDVQSETASAEHMHQVLSGGELKGFKVGLVHGQMDQELKARIMASFRDGRLNAVVATTVIEVGIDVPNATLLVVHEAERFGLSQLHQLRGRIGRGKFQGYCFLFSESDSPEAARRLDALVESADGFRIAEVDFQIRGPGDVLGTRQHGDLPLRVADLTEDQELLESAREQAFELVRSGRFDEPEFVPLKVRVLERFSGLMELPQSG